MSDRDRAIDELSVLRKRVDLLGMGVEFGTSDAPIGSRGLVDRMVDADVSFVDEGLPSELRGLEFGLVPTRFDHVDVGVVTEELLVSAGWHSYVGGDGVDAAVSTSLTDLVSVSDVPQASELPPPPLSPLSGSVELPGEMLSDQGVTLSAVEAECERVGEELSTEELRAQLSAYSDQIVVLSKLLAERDSSLRDVRFVLSLKEDELSDLQKAQADSTSKFHDAEEALFSAQLELSRLRANVSVVGSPILDSSGCSVSVQTDVELTSQLETELASVRDEHALLMDAYTRASQELCEKRSELSLLSSRVLMTGPVTEFGPSSGLEFDQTSVCPISEDRVVTQFALPDVVSAELCVSSDAPVVAYPCEVVSDSVGLTSDAPVVGVVCVDECIQSDLSLIFLLNRFVQLSCLNWDLALMMH
ncbi:hypothetical protein FGIG_00830 [Fasciola gigantica]|uniref:Uncharacterized protein n=1 Tax=Fasciola gigantica TaxID=46835 RepID=A0A504YSX2_FASGI|nr:hypothetical protein FGIG_00830 [Fasciola gigantica]